LQGELLVAEGGDDLDTFAMIALAHRERRNRAADLGALRLDGRAFDCRKDGLLIGQLDWPDQDGIFGGGAMGDHQRHENCSKSKTHEGSCLTWFSAGRDTLQFL
jgi:hypothetical protein